MFCTRILIRYIVSADFSAYKVVRAPGVRVELLFEANSPYREPTVVRTYFFCNRYHQNGYFRFDV